MEPGDVSIRYSQLFSASENFEKQGYKQHDTCITDTWNTQIRDVKPVTICPFHQQKRVTDTPLPKTHRNDTFSREIRKVSEMESGGLLSGLAACKEPRARHGEASHTNCDDSLPPTCRCRVIFSAPHCRRL